MRLEIDRWGKITTEEVEVNEVNTENNLSNIEYETRHVMVNGGRRWCRFIIQLNNFRNNYKIKI